MERIFLLSPAQCSGRRAATILAERATFPLARRLRQPGAPLGEVFAFLSGLYFRGKLAYARTFAQPPVGVDGALVITPCRGLASADHPITHEDLREFAAVPIQLDEPRYRRPFESDARRLARTIGGDCDVVLLGSVATTKYTEVLAAIFGPRLRFPQAFTGRGDKSRGGLMLRCVDERRELEYVGIAATPIRGPRPPRLAP